MFSGFLRSVIPHYLRPIGYLTSLAQTRTNLTVLTGSFAGTKYVKVSQGSAYIPKLLGIYERELTSQIEEIVTQRPRLIVDVGAAEGYYAVGLARRLPETKVIAFEMEERGQVALNELKDLNGVTNRVEVRGKCEPSDLNSTLGDGIDSVVVCDVEGYEECLLNPASVPALQKATILVELHDFIIPNITETLKERFKGTHEIFHIWQEPRSIEEFPWRTFGTSILPKSYLEWAVSEWRPVRMAWLYMKPKQASGVSV